MGNVSLISPPIRQLSQTTGLGAAKQVLFNIPSINELLGEHIEINVTTSDTTPHATFLQFYIMVDTCSISVDISIFQSKNCRSEQNPFHTNDWIHSNLNHCPGCVLTHGERNYSVAPSCGPVTAAASEVVLLVHGFYPSLWADPVTWLREFYEIKDRVLEQEYS